MRAASATRSPLLSAAVLMLAVSGGGAAWYLSQPEKLAVPVLETTTEVDRAPMCPWRDPEADLKALFPGATAYSADTRVLSAQRLELQRRLGRPPSPEESALNLYRVNGPSGAMGIIIPQRVKGEFGAIELVIAVGKDGKVRGLRIQRQREPVEVARVLLSPKWLAGFNGWDADNTPRRGALIAEMPADGRESAVAVAEGVHAVLNLYVVAERSGISAPHH